MLRLLLLGCAVRGKYVGQDYLYTEEWRSPQVSFPDQGWYNYDSGFYLFNTTVRRDVCVSDQTNIPVHEHYLYEVNDTRIPASQVKWLRSPDRLDLDVVAANQWGPYALPKDDAGVGPKVIHGHKLDTDRFSYTSLDPYVNHFSQILLPEIYCAGARYRKTLFVPEVNKHAFLRGDNLCAQQCFDYLNSKTAAGAFDIVEFVQQPFLVGCRIPLVQTFQGSLLKTKFNNAPVGSVQFPTTTFSRALGQLRKNQLIDVLIKVRLTSNAPNPFYNPLQDISIDNSWLASSDYHLPNKRGNKLSKLQYSTQGILKTGRQDDRGEVLSLLKTLDKASRGDVRGRRRTKEAYTEPYNFYDSGLVSIANASERYIHTNSGKMIKYSVPIQGPLRVLAASSVEFGGYGLNNFKMPTHTGYYADRARIVEMPQPFEAIVDMGPSVRRALDSKHLEFSLLSTATLVGAEPEFVFHIAKDWLYFVPHHSPCQSQRTSRSCEYWHCNWCGKLQTGNDWLHPGLTGYQNVQPLGSCGVPIDVCYMRNGISTRTLRAK